jgi:hypothetical protein
MIVVILVALGLFLIPAMMLWSFFRSGDQADPGGSWGDQMLGDKDQRIE